MRSPEFFHDAPDGSATSALPSATRCAAARAVRGSPRHPGPARATVAGGPSIGARLTALRRHGRRRFVGRPRGNACEGAARVLVRALARALTTTDDVGDAPGRVGCARVPAGKGGSATLADALLRVARDTGTAAGGSPRRAVRASRRRSTVDADLFALLRTSLEPARPAPLRTAAAAVVEKATLDRSQLLALAALARDRRAARARTPSAGVREVDRRSARAGDDRRARPVAGPVDRARRHPPARAREVSAGRAARRRGAC